MNYLAIDSCSSVLSAAVSRSDEIFYAVCEEGMKHSELVMDLIDSLIKKAALKPVDLNGVFCMKGPGSFTGLRIGYSIAKALSLSLSIPFAPVPALDCIAATGDFAGSSCGEVSFTRKEQKKAKIALAVIQARKNAYFYAFFSGTSNEVSCGTARLTPDKDAGINQITDEIKRYNEYITLTGPGSVFFFNSMPQELKEKTNLRYENSGYAKDIIAFAKNKNILNKDTSDFLFSGPEYNKKTDAEASLAMLV